MWLLMSVRICRVNPTVLGTKPKPSKGHSAVPLNEGRILVIQKGSSLDDGVWFLEVGIINAF